MGHDHHHAADRNHPRHDAGDVKLTPKKEIGLALADEANLSDLGCVIAGEPFCEPVRM